jgi:hypothetical protein
MLLLSDSSPCHRTKDTNWTDPIRMATLIQQVAHERSRNQSRALVVSVKKERQNAQASVLYVGSVAIVDLTVLGR